MEFSGPEPADLVDVLFINSAFLDYLRSEAGERLLRRLPGQQQPLVAALTDWQIARLAATPFLLLTLDETDDAGWKRILDELPICDLFVADQGEADPLGRIASAALGFLWQLSRRNMYAARLIGGASLTWCEEIAARSLVHVLHCAARHQDLVAPRLAAHEIFWARLLSAGVSAADDVRKAAHLSAMQMMLSPGAAGLDRRWRSAACHAAIPSLKTQE